MIGLTADEKLKAEKKRAIAWLRGMALMIVFGIPVAFFVQAGRQIDINRNLLLAIRRNDAPTVAFLLDAGAEANTREPIHETRPMLQQILDSIRGVHPATGGPSALLIHLALVPDSSKPPRSWSKRPENVEIVRALLEHHADPNIRGDYETTPLMIAVQQEKDSTLQLLLKHGARVDLKDSQGFSALQLAVEMGSVERVQRLLDAGADVNSRDSVQNTPLMNAVTQKDIAIVKLLIARGADVNARDSAQDSVLTYARRVHSEPIIALLKAAGAR
jgi:ankyrin repeat protein